MSVDSLVKQWGCGKPGANHQRMGSITSIVCDIGDPCLHHSPIKVNKMLKPDKWQAVFDSEGKALGFQKALKLIILGGVDPSIRSEVWEFLLGCYALGSTREYRNLLRAARRERYEELVRQCQKMHSSIGTGSLAYVVGSKIMDVRAYSKDDVKREADSEERHASGDDTNKLNAYCDRNNNCTDTTYTCQRASSSDSSDVASVRESIDSAAYDSSCLVPSPVKFNCSSLRPRRQANESQFPVDEYYDFPALPVTDLFEKSDESDQANESHDDGHSTPWKRVGNQSMHSFQIDNNDELVIESNGSRSSVRQSISSEIEMADGRCDTPHEQVLRQDIQKYKNKVLNKLRISDVPETAELYSSKCEEAEPSEDKVSEWLWTLHRIVVDVVRTDSHLEFYEDPKNLARMSDILAVYAWVDPETGYCQGMSDLLSPFVVLFENDADAFWCFEMLLRRTRENFRMEGQTGVMKQLQTLWQILKLTDREMFSHLTHIGAESLHFAFRMLLVLFRRELSFTEALCMWEMMWAADFDEPLSWNLAQNCLEPLVLQLPDDVGTESGEERKETDDSSSKSGPLAKNENSEHASSEEAAMKSLASNHSFCGLTRTFWSRSDRTHERTGFSATRNGEDDLPVFCVAAILILNRHKVIKETRSIDDLIKICNDNVLKIRVKRCIRTAIKLRKKYFYKMIKYSNPSPQKDPPN
ncbi:small G protein signaling modulator 1-like isoform X1 [Chenopodium quinoa]|uniref:small G protein signaling modulator 1-like isoform X1 n=2 Tax=Chenopodium quinoa TaxID=63459 RepID=UPI000B7893D0|nr:small G protein signaling modulator 1-like isoform X1 [Chenopodium quinoa]XP_021774883.1 small G protein signaling modulator 1-like isoform X1 [Chenopodium quinoa]